MQANEWQALLITLKSYIAYILYTYIHIHTYAHMYMYIYLYLVRLWWRCRRWGNLFESEKNSSVFCSLSPSYQVMGCVCGGEKGRVSSSPAPGYSSNAPYTPTHIRSPVFNFYLIAFVDSNCRSRIVLRLLFYSFVPCVFPILFHISAFYGASLSMWGLGGDRALCTWWVGALCLAPALRLAWLSSARALFFASVSTLRCFCSCRRRKFPISVAVAIMWGLSK